MNATPVEGTFRTAYREIESQMKALAEADGDIFLPNPEPEGPTDYVFICMEPSLGLWARSEDDARSKIAAGFRNFLSSIEDFILHFCIRRYLCKPAERYHITDVSKGAMLVERAARARVQRYDRWYALLEQEIDLVAKVDAGIFAVGAAVTRYLERREFTRKFKRIIHYSGLAGRGRAAGIAGHEEDFAVFRDSITLEDVIGTAEHVLRSAGVPDRLHQEVLSRLAKSRLSPSRKQLAFNYKVAFETSPLEVNGNET